MDADVFREEWRNQSEPWQRLVWARTYWQVRANAISGTASDAADSLGMKPGTYRAYERPPGSSKHTPLNHQEAIRFARKFQVDWTWLLLGEGTPFDNQLPPAQERVVRAMCLADESEQNALADMIEAFMRRKEAS